MAVRRNITAYDVSKNGNVIVRASTPDRPYEIFAAEKGNLRDLTKQNDAWLSQSSSRASRKQNSKAKTAPRCTAFSFTLSILPPQARSPRALATARRTAIAIRERVRFREAAFCGERLHRHPAEPARLHRTRREICHGHFAALGETVDVEDDLAAVDDAVARGLADPDRLGVGGWSYGGISTNYLIASTTRFKAATSGASISNVLAGYGTDQYIIDYEQELGMPWKNTDTYLKLSYPFLHADRIKTPTLFLCGENDFNVPLLNTEQMYQALRSLGVPTELVIYPGQNHGLKKPSYIIDRFKRYLDWYAKWMGAAKAPP